MPPADSPLARIAAALALIETRLRSPLTVAELADAAGYSLHHFCRLFNQTARFTPFDYLMRRRLAAAAESLAGSRRKVVDLAFEFQFGSHEAFSRAFRRVFGLSPSAFRRQGRIDRRTALPALTLAHLEHFQQALAQPPQPVRLPGLELLGLMAPLQLSGAGWEAQVQRLAQAMGPLPVPAEGWARLSFPAGWTTDADCWLMSGFAAPPGAADENALLAQTRVPGGRYARLAQCAPVFALPLTLDYLYHAWLPRLDQRPRGDYLLLQEMSAGEGLTVYLPLDD